MSPTHETKRECRALSDIDLRNRLALHKEWSVGDRARGKRANFRAMDLAGRYLANAQLSDAYFLDADLEGTNLGHANLKDANLACAYISEAYVAHADLSGACLAGAHLGGADLRGAVLRSTDLERAHLVKADLCDAQLQKAYLAHADLRRADLRANFEGANLCCADLRESDLRSADLEDARLDGANLQGADLRGANLQNASLAFANLREANLTGANFRPRTVDGAFLLDTVLFDVELAPLVAGNLFSCGPCSVDHRAIARSLRAGCLEDFLVTTGMPRNAAQYMIDCMRALDPLELFSMMQSTFISYGGPDEPFAARLSKALSIEGVQTFFFPEDAVPGQRLHRTMRDGVQSHERVVLICSRASLDRPGVLNEIEMCLAREAQEAGAEILVPVTLDNYLYEEWSPKLSGLRNAILERVVADFRGADTDTATFSKALSRLLRALRKVALNQGRRTLG